MTRTVATLIAVALANPGRLNTYYGAQLPDHGFPFGDHGAVASWLGAEGFVHLQDLGSHGWMTPSGVTISDHGVVRLARTSNL